MNLLIHGLLLTISSSLYAALSKIIIVVYYNYFSLQTANSEFMHEIFEPNEGGTIAVRSSIISMSLIQNVIKTEPSLESVGQILCALPGKPMFKPPQRSMIIEMRLSMLRKP